MEYLGRLYKEWTVENTDMVHFNVPAVDMQQEIIEDNLIIA